MPALSNARHERFAQELAKGKSQVEAHELAGFKAHRGNASSLAQSKSILERVAEIGRERSEMVRGATEKATQQLSVTVESLLAEAEQARVLAMSGGQPAAAVAAIKEKGVLAGLRVERSERRTVNDARTLTDAELDAAIAEALAREQEAESGQGLPN